ncbi:hypothetical protein D3C76_638640 [compost metagenome]|uniref:Uncharacterized protein n=1 Tax=Pseudomonas jinjuensis TaxID=198616 RepID=A0A1H0AAD4_9PSED|nr:hypothetical protein [Pseudomonas jinjuensis]SDN30234.1 hypothetical protein SAMN05216193_102145 [Pseudomonas jinjuensis]
MSTLLILAACVLACWLCCQGRRDLEQASLLPFADDPEAAERMSEATGLRCERVVTPVFEPIEPPGDHSFRA